MPSSCLAIILSIRFKWKDSSILLLGLILVFIGGLIKINYKFTEPQNQYQYYSGSVLFYLATTIIEGASMAIIAKTISPSLNLGYWNAGLLGGCAELGGRTLGNISFTIYTYFPGLKPAEPCYAYSVNTVITVIMIGLTLFLYRKLTKHIEIKIEYSSID